MINKNISLIIIIIILILLVIILPYIKNNVLYHPLPANNDKYNKFYKKLAQLVETENDFQNHKIKTIDGVHLDVIYLINHDSDKCIIFFHGNAGNISTRFDVIKFLYNYASVITFDYRSFGKSENTYGYINANMLHIDAKTVWMHAINKLNILPSNISFFGESLGSAIALNLAAVLSKKMNEHHYPHSVICNASFASLDSMVEEIFRNIKMGFAGKIFGAIYGTDYRPINDIKFINHKTKIILAHSPNDEIIPYTESQKLYNAVANIHPNISFITIGGTHNNLNLSDEYIYSLANLFND